MRLNPSFFLASVLPLLVYAVIDSSTAGLANIHAGGIVPDFAPGSSYLENAARNWVFSTGAIFGFLVILTAAFCLYEVAEAAFGDADQPRTRRMSNALWTYGFIAALVAGTFLAARMIGTLTDADPRIYRLFGRDLFVAVLNSCVETFGQPTDCTFGRYRPGAVPTGFTGVLTFNIVLSSLGLAFASTGCCLSLCQSAEALRDRTRAELFRLPQLFLRLSSAMFTAAILSVYAWTSWPIGFLSEADAETYRAFQSSMVIFYGIALSVIILAFYAPCVFILNERLSRLRRKETPPASDGDAPATTAELVERALTFMSPLLTAVISALAAGFVSFG